MKRQVLMSALAALTITLTATAAQAAPLTLDFAADIYAGANGKPFFGLFSAFVDQGVTVKFMGSGNLLSQDAVNGIGINGFGGDNGADGEILSTGFGLSQYVHSVELAQFFPDEVGYYQVNGDGVWVPFTAIKGDGSFSLILDRAEVLFISFKGECGDSPCGLNDDFSIKSITVGEPLNPSEVPEPASMILLGTGLLAAAAHRRRKKTL